MKQTTKDALTVTAIILICLFAENLLNSIF